MYFASFRGVQDLSDDIKIWQMSLKRMPENVHKDEFEIFWNLFVNVSKHDLLHLKAESFLFQME